MHKLMTSRDLAKIFCKACNGCGECCHGMDDTIHLDPYDIFMLTGNLKKSFSDLINVRIGLHVETGLVLPHLLMRGENVCCTFLRNDGRCGIHAFRPGFCRLFPLGREYDGKTFRYFVTDGGCNIPGKTKVRIDRYLEIPDLKRYEAFVTTWHYFKKSLEEFLYDKQDAELNQRIALFILEMFYERPYNTDGDFYVQFDRRLRLAEDALSDLSLARETWRGIRGSDS